VEISEGMSADIRGDFKRVNVLINLRVSAATEGGCVYAYLRDYSLLALSLVLV